MTGQPERVRTGEIVAAGWQLDTWRDEDGAGRIVAQEVYPRGDVVDHDVAPLTSTDCVCGPDLELLAPDGRGDRWMVTHHALDGRV